jgi:hypothetical protein
LGLGTLATQNGTITDYLTTAAAATTYQPLDADLTALAALTGTDNIYYRSAADTWTAVTIGTGLTFTGGTLAASGGAGITSLNGLTGATQTFAVATTGTDFAITSSGTAHTFAIPSASATARGLVTTAAQTIAGDKTFSGRVAVGGVTPLGSLSLPLFQWISWGTAQLITSDGNNIRLNSVPIQQIAWLGLGGSNDVRLERDAAGTLNQRNGTNAQVWRLCNTWTSSTSYEWVAIGWSGNVCTITTEKGSAGGTLRGLRIGDASTALLGFYGATPVDRPDTIADPSGGLVVDAEARTAINALIDRLQELGLIA